MRIHSRLCLAFMATAASLLVPVEPVTAEVAVAADGIGRSLRFEAVRGLNVVQIRIGSSEPLDFVLDSGSQHTTLNDLRLVEALNLHTRVAGRGRGFGGERLPVFVAPDVALRAGDDVLYRTDLVVHHVSPDLGRSIGRDLHGLLGSDLFGRFVVEIDPAQLKLVLHDPDGFQYAGDGHSIALEIDEGRPLVRGRVTMVDGKRAKVRLLLDTGSETAVALIRDSRRALRVPEGSERATAIGLGGDVTVFVGPIAGLELGSLSLGRTPASFFQRHMVPAASSMHGLHGIIGNGLLREYRTFVDFRRGRLILEPLTDRAQRAPDDH